tara:strand:- start:93 stop:308 length:216 start_codon:yes stop_codon:yes gene_type:complete
MVKDLSAYLTEIFSVPTIEQKKEITRQMIQDSYAKKTTKKLAIVRLDRLNSNIAIENYAKNYMLSGEGYKV